MDDDGHHALAVGSSFWKVRVRPYLVQTTAAAPAGDQNVADGCGPDRLRHRENGAGKLACVG